MSAVLEEKQDTAPHVLFTPVMSGRGGCVGACVSSMKPHEYTLYRRCPPSWGIPTDIQPPSKWRGPQVGRDSQGLIWVCPGNRSTPAVMRIDDTRSSAASIIDGLHLCRPTTVRPQLGPASGLEVSCEICHGPALSSSAYVTIQLFRKMGTWARSINVWPFSLNAKNDEIRSGLPGQVRGYLHSKWHVCYHQSVAAVFHMCVNPVLPLSSVRCWYALFSVLRRGTVLNWCKQKKKSLAAYHDPPDRREWRLRLFKLVHPEIFLAVVLIGGAVCAHAHAYASRAERGLPPQQGRRCHFRAR